MKLKYIDSTRGIAILMVILVHTAQKIPDLDFLTSVISSYGQMGVQLFFVVSAYTLCLSSIRRDKESFPLLKFGIRRYFRIAPAYYLALIGYLILSVIFWRLESGEFSLPNRYTFPNILTNVFFIHGFYPPANNNIVPGGWSIGTEMAFYSIFPFLFSIFRTKFSSSKKGVFAFIILGILLSQLVLALISFVGFEVSNNNFIYFNLINQLPVFLIGFGYFFLSQNRVFKFRWYSNLLFFILFTLISIYLGYSGEEYYFSLIPIISGFSFIFLMELLKHYSILNPKVLIRIGQTSFSMYLIHFLFAHSLTGFLIDKLTIVNGTVSLLIFYVLSVIFTFHLSLICERFIEKPGIEFGKKIIQKLDVLHAVSLKAKKSSN